MWEAREHGDDASDPFGLGRGVEVQPDPVGEFDRDGRETCVSRLGRWLFDAE